MFSFFKKEKWALVKSFKIDRSVYRGAYVYHIHLFESDSGKRKADFYVDGEKYNIDKKDSWLKTQDIYQLKVYRWLQGRMDPEIPRYDQIPEEDTANFLKGTV